MSEQPGERQSIESRIARLEMQNRLLKRIGLAGVLLIGCVGLMGQTQTKPQPKKKTTKPAAVAPTPAASAEPTVVEATGFILKDANGKVRAELSMGATEPTLKLRDENGAALVTLSLNEGNPGGPLLLLADPQHQASVSISVLQGSGAQMSLIGATPETQIHLGVAPDGTAMELSDKDGFSTNIGDGVLTKGGQVKKTSAAAIALFNKDRKVLWSAP